MPRYSVDGFFAAVGMSGNVARLEGVDSVILRVQVTAWAHCTRRDIELLLLDLNLRGNIVSV